MLELHSHYESYNGGGGQTYISFPSLREKILVARLEQQGLFLM